MMNTKKINYIVGFMVLLFSYCAHTNPSKKAAPEEYPKALDRNNEFRTKLPKYTIERHEYSNGQLEYEASYRKGKLDGVAKHWDENGNLISTVEYSNGDIHGKWILYYPNGQILQVTEYFRGRKNGYERKYHPNGQLSSEVQYQMDKKISKTIRWDSKGKLLY